MCEKGSFLNAFAKGGRGLREKMRARSSGRVSLESEERVFLCAYV